MDYYWSLPSDPGPSTFTTSTTTTSSLPSTPPSPRPSSLRRKRLRRQDETLESAGKGAGIGLACLTTLFTAPTFTLAVTPTRLYPPPPPNRPTIPTRHKRDAEIRSADTSTSSIQDVAEGDTPLVYPTSVTRPTDLPTHIVTVDENVLPYYLTQDANGKWYKVDNAWRLYGREAGVKEDGVLIGSSDNNFAVDSSLPKGWGRSSSRTNLYRVPLIVACSMILAIAIVVATIFLVFNRRKAHRKAKRKAERQRRKALQAAGIDPDVQDGRAQEAAFKEKLQQLEKQHRSKKRKDGNVGFSKIKVKRWTSGLRRRRGKDETDEGSRPSTPTIEVIQEEEPKIEEQEDRTPSVNTINSIVPGEATDTTDGLGPRTETEDSTRPTDASPELSVENATGDAPAPYLPPEYRPASVRSYQMHDSGVGGSSRRRSSIGAAPAGVSDKTRAPGYYPAPATEDGEQALAVVSRAEGKRPIRPPSPDAEAEMERVRHIATDDKRLLEQMRLGASAPPRSAPASNVDEDGAGPSAPDVEVDQDGFERFSHIPQEASSPSLPSGSTRLPAPPKLVTQRSIAAEPVSELHLLPSAPPGVLDTSLPSAPPLPASPLVPSAPPLALEGDEDDQMQDVQSGSSTPVQLATPIPEHQNIPSAPTLAEEEEEVEAEVVHEAEAADGELVSEPPVLETQEPARPRLFLPKYEP